MATEKELHIVDLAGARLTLMSLDMIIDAIEKHGTVTVVNARSCPQGSTLRMEFGAQLHDMFVRRKE